MPPTPRTHRRSPRLRRWFAGLSGATRAQRLLPARRGPGCLLPILGALALFAPVTVALADATPSAPPAVQTATESTTTGPSSSSSSSSTTVGSGSATSTTPSGEGAAETTTSSTQTQSAPESAPQVHAQTPQAAGGTPHAHPHPKAHPPSAPKGTSPTHVSALPPSALTPPPPGALGSAISGVPSFFIANFAIPPFLLPIFQAAGRTYGIPWQVLAAINEVETDYGRDLSLSSAGAEGWMQFLPSSWATYGVDANGDGYADPYNPADAIFAAARYLKAAGGARHIDAAIFAYNHSQSYVASVLLRAQLLAGTPPQLLDTISSLTEARFPVHAPAHFSDGFPTVPAATPGRPPRTLVGTTIYSSPAAPVIAVQDGVIAAIGSSPTLGRYVVLRDDYGNTYTYGQLGSVAALYPVLKPHRAAPVGELGRAGSAGVDQAGRRVARRGAVSFLIPPASAGVQPHSPFSAGAVSSGLALGAAAELESLPLAAARPTPARRSPHRARRAPAPSRVFRAGSEDVFLHPLRVGARVIAGTVIGHLAATAGEVSMLFQIRPAGVGAPQIDPKPLLDSWVQLQGSLIFRVTGKHRFPAAAPAAKPTSCAGSKAHAVSRPLTAPKPFAASCPATALSAQAESSTLTPGQWLQLVARLGQIPDPVVAAKPSAAAIPDRSPAAPAGAASEGSGVHN